MNENYYNKPLPVSSHPAFKELAKYVFEEHMKRRPAIDAKMRPLREEAWQIWDQGLPIGHPRKGIRPQFLHQGGNLATGI